MTEGRNYRERALAEHFQLKIQGDSGQTAAFLYDPFWSRLGKRNLMQSLQADKLSLPTLCKLLGEFVHRQAEILSQMSGRVCACVCWHKRDQFMQLPVSFWWWP